MSIVLGIIGIILSGVILYYLNRGVVRTNHCTQIKITAIVLLGIHHIITVQAIAYFM